MAGGAAIGAILVTDTDGDLVSALAGDPIGLRTRMPTGMARGGALLTIIIHALILIILRLPARILFPTTAAATVPRKILDRTVTTTPRAKPSSLPAPENFRNAASVINVAASTRTAPTYKTDADSGAALYRLAFTMQELPPVRKEVQNVILALRAMPPDARQRQIDSGRYSIFSPEEIDLLRSSSHLPITW